MTTQISMWYNKAMTCPIDALKPHEPCAISRISAYVIAVIAVALVIIGVLSYHNLLPNAVTNGSLAVGGGICLIAAIVNSCTPPIVIETTSISKAHLERQRSLLAAKKGENWQHARGQNSETLKASLNNIFKDTSSASSDEDQMREILSADETSNPSSVSRNSDTSSSSSAPL